MGKIINQCNIFALLLFCLISLSLFACSMSAEEYYDSAFNKGMDGNTAAAIVALDKAISIDSTKWYYFGLRGSMKYRNGDYLGALKDLSHSIVLNPNDYMLFLMRGKTFIAVRDYDAAIKDLSRSSEILPERVMPYMYRGFSKYMKRDINGAMADFNLAVELCPSWKTYFARGITRISDGDFLKGLIDLFYAIINMEINIIESGR